MKFKLLRYSLLALLFFLNNPVLAEDPRYQIELMVFSQTLPNTEVFEQTISQIAWPSDLTELSAYKIADATALADSYAAMAKDPVYRPMLHISWIQAGQGAPVHIQSGDGKLNGYVQLQQGSGLQLRVDLEFAANQGELIYHLTEKRSVKLNEDYYLDHPLFGLVATIKLL